VGEGRRRYQTGACAVMSFPISYAGCWAVFAASAAGETGETAFEKSTHVSAQVLTQHSMLASVCFFGFCVCFLQVLIVTGDTGCGKSTQVPQFILEAAQQQGTLQATNIVVSQPRRLITTCEAEPSLKCMVARGRCGLFSRHCVDAGRKPSADTPVAGCLRCCMAVAAVNPRLLC
jgi:ABC-type phosphonate transport system ATPase subunit